MLPRKLGGIFPFEVCNKILLMDHAMTPLKVGFLRRILTGAVFMFAATLGAAQSVSEYTPLVATAAFTSFKEQNAPGGAAVVGVAGVATVRTKHDGLTLQKVKLFVPPGAKRLGISLTTYAVEQDARAVAKFGTPPVSSYGDVLPETAVSDTRPSLKRLLAGDELKFYSPARSGVLMMANSENTDTFVGSAGGYIYFNFLSIPANQILSISTRLEVDESCYSNWYANATWDQSGNPIEGAAHTCSGSTGGNTGGGTGTGGSTNSGAFNFLPAELVLGSVETTTILPNPVTASLAACSSTSPYLSIVGRQVYLSALGRYLRTATSVVVTCGTDSKTLNILPTSSNSAALTGITLSTNSLIVGGTTNSVTVQPTPTTATLPQCTVNSSGYLSISGTTVTLKSDAGALLNTRDETITCGSFTKTITVKPAGSVASVVPEVMTAADGKITLRLTLNLPQSDVSAGVTTNIWVGAHLPAGAVFFNEDIWFFKTPTVWREIDGIDINALAFARNQPVAAKQVFDVPLGLTASDLRPFGIEIYFGYANSNGNFINLGKVW